MQDTFNTENLVLMGGKRRWVPMWVWLHIIFRFELYEYSPISWLTYKRASYDDGR